MIQFAPDVDPATPEVFVDATNIVPTMKGYTASYTGQNTSYSALATDVRNIIVTRKLDKPVTAFAHNEQAFRICRLTP
jgi:hypothetical protein